MTFVGVFINPDFRPAIVAIAVLYAIGLALLGAPDAEGYGGAVEDELLAEEDRG